MYTHNVWVLHRFSTELFGHCRLLIDQALQCSNSAFVEAAPPPFTFVQSSGAADAAPAEGTFNLWKLHVALVDLFLVDGGKVDLQSHKEGIMEKRDVAVGRSRWSINTPAKTVTSTHLKTTSQEEACHLLTARSCWGTDCVCVTILYQ